MKIESLNKNEVKILLSELLKKMDGKNNNFKLHSSYGIEFTAYPISKIIYFNGKTNGFSNRILQIGEMYNFLEGNRISVEKITDVIKIANEFIYNY